MTHGQGMDKGAGGGPELVFIVPVRHPQSVSRWDVVMSNLSSTLASIAAQKGGRWRCRVVANRGAVLPGLFPGCERRDVDLPLPDLPDRTRDREGSYEAVRHDKGLRIYEGLRDMAPDSYAMVVDFDDFVSNRLAEFVGVHAGGPGWYINRGYIYSGGGSWCYATDRFDRMCGTSHIVRRDAFGVLEGPEGAPDMAAVRRRVGSHVFIKPDLEAAGTPLLPLPFPGAVYRIGNPESTSGTGTLFRTMTPIKAFARHPRETVRRLTRYRRMSPALRREFAIS